jgi:outer membrane receptor protein involved in Fe transport
LLVLVAQQAAAQQGVVRGTVRSPQGAPIRGAMVGIAGSTLYTQSDPAGRYRLAPVPAGETRVRAAAIGYSPAATIVTLAPGDSVTADFTLDPSPLELTALDVVSTKVPQFGDHPATSVVQVSPEEIDRRAVNTIDEAVDKEAGIQFLNGQINIRGSTGYVQGLNSRVLMLVDGVPMNQGDRGGINWDLVPVDQIERVDILKGAGSSLYGSAALGGVVNVTTRDVPVGVHERVRLTGGIYADPPHSVWEFRNEPGLQGGGDGTISYGTETAGASIQRGRPSFGWISRARHADALAGGREGPVAGIYQNARGYQWRLGRRPLRRAAQLVHAGPVRGSRAGVPTLQGRHRRPGVVDRFAQRIPDRPGAHGRFGPVCLAGARLVVPDRFLRSAPRHV